MSLQPTVVVYVSTTPLEPILSDLSAQVDTLNANVAALRDLYTTLLLAVKSIGEGVTQMGVELDNLTAQVSKNDDVEASALLLIQGLAAQIAAAGTDPSKLNALTASLKTNADALAAAVAANTPAATPPAGGASVL